jgi:hypothetical protein
VYDNERYKLLVNPKKQNKSPKNSRGMNQLSTRKWSTYPLLPAASSKRWYFFKLSGLKSRNDTDIEK